MILLINEAIRPLLSQFSANHMKLKIILKAYI